MLKLTKREKLAIVAKVRRQVQARAAAAGRLPDTAGFKQRQATYLAAHPHLARHNHCGLCPDSEPPRHRVKLPNGIVIFSAWYKVHDVVQSQREAKWMECPRLEYQGLSL